VNASEEKLKIEKKKERWEKVKYNNKKKEE